MKHLKLLKRVFLYLIFAVLSVILVNKWYKDYPPQEPEKVVEKAQQKPGDSVDNLNTMRPIAASSVSKAQKTPVMKHAEAVDKLGKTPDHTSYIKVSTKTLSALIDLHGGNVTQVSLPKYTKSVGGKTPMTILSDDTHELYVAQSYLAKAGSDKSESVTYTTAKQSYSIGGRDKLVVNLTGKTASGLKVYKTYTFWKGRYKIDLNEKVINTTATPESVSLYTQLVRKKPISKGGSSFYRRSYLGASISSPKRPYHKLSYKDMNKKDVSATNQGGWIAMQQHYFLSAWVPANQKISNHFYSYVLDKLNQRPVYVVGFKGADLSLAPGQSGEVGATLYVGPEDTKHLALLAPGLNHTIDFGWLWPISSLLFSLMAFCNRFLGNWGWSIVLTTIMIKIVFYWFSAKSFISMAKMRDLQPKLKALQKQHADDKQALSQATMGLYKKEGVSPLGGCLPMIIQIPVFIALYYVIFESVELRHAPFMFWVHDLSAPDPYYVLPIIMVLSMVLQQFLSPTATDPSQAKMMLILPLVMGFLFRHFPSGLVLYWCVNNLVQAFQQWYVTKRFHAGKYRKKLKKKRA